MKPVRFHGLAALAAVLAIPALATAAPVTTIIRVEGGSAALLPEQAVTVDDTAPPVVVDDTTDSDTVTVPARSATAQLAQAAGGAGLALGFDVFDFGAGPTSFITRIGGDLMPASFTPSWRFKVNNVAASVGSDSQILNPGDSVTWAFVSDFGARELDLSVSGDKLAQGQTFTATVRSFDNAGVAVPAAGASIRYGEQTATADTTGRATFLATGIGVQTVTATRTGEVRSQARLVCSFAADPGVCSLPALPPAPPAPAGASAVAADNVPPGSAFAFPVSGRRYRAVPALRGTAGPDRSDVAGVEVALARRVGTLCRFMGPRGGFSAPRPCFARRLIPARSSGGRWLLAMPTPLPPGKYRAWSRATDGARNTETTGISTVNAISFTVLPKGAAR